MLVSISYVTKNWCDLVVLMSLYVKQCIAAASNAFIEILLNLNVVLVHY